MKKNNALPGGGMTGMNEKVMNIGGVDCYERDGVAYLELDAVARGLGFTTTQIVNGTEYINVRWRRVDEYLKELNFATCGKRPDFIPENIFYRLAMKAKNDVAEAFQAKVADEIIPSIRKHGAYLTPETIEAAIVNPDIMIQLPSIKMILAVRVQSLCPENSVRLIGLCQLLHEKSDRFFVIL